MSRHLFAHTAALHHQVRRIRRAALLSLTAMLPCAAILLATTEAHWLSIVLALILMGYTHRKLRQVFWARRTVKQLRLEEQFVRHGPTPEQVLPCTRRYDHLWTRSLTLKGLKMMIERSSGSSLPAETSNSPIDAHFTGAFKTLRPSPWPGALIWFAALALGWLWLVPDALLQDMPPHVFAGLALLLLILVAEVVQQILRADLRDGLDHFLTLLGAWIQTRAFDTAFGTLREKPYRHTALYRSWVFPRPVRRANKSTALSTTPPVPALELAQEIEAALSTESPAEHHRRGFLLKQDRILANPPSKIRN